jgi:hypothetical protein
VFQSGGYNRLQISCSTMPTADLLRKGATPYRGRLFAFLAGSPLFPNCGATEVQLVSVARSRELTAEDETRVETKVFATREDAAPFPFEGIPVCADPWRNVREMFQCREDIDFPHMVRERNRHRESRGRLFPLAIRYKLAQTHLAGDLLVFALFPVARFRRLFPADHCRMFRREHFRGILGSDVELRRVVILLENVLAE